MPTQAIDKTHQALPLFDWDKIKGTFYSGGWQKGATVVDVIEPATGNILTQVGLGNAEIVANAAKIAAKAQKEWVKVPPEEKRKLFIEAERVARKYQPEIEEWVMREVGAIRSKAKFEVEFLSDEFLEASAYPTQQMGHFLGDRAGRKSYAIREPYGVTAGITPFNVPLTLGSRYIAPALAMGNAVLLKPHRNAIVCSGLVFARILEEAGFPDGIFHVIPVEGPDAAVFETDPNISMVHFTGSTATGQRIAETASRSLKKVSISGSGKNPFIVLDDITDLDAVISAAVYSTYYFSGQVCMAAGRQLIHQSLLQDYTDRLVKRAEALVVADPWTNANAHYGPMSIPGSAERLEAITQDAVEKGAKLLTGGKRNGPFFSPTVLTGVKPGMRAWDEEVFGPIAAITSFNTDDEAVQLANDTPYGLSAAVFGSPNRATKLGELIQSGMVHINDKPVDDAAYVPFGGVKGSGNGGRYGSYVNWDEYTQWRWFTVSDHQTPVPFGH